MVYCKKCGDELEDGICPTCYYRDLMYDIKTAKIVDGDLCMYGCHYRWCLKKDGASTQFCKYLQQISLRVTGGYLIHCRKEYEGESEQ